MAQNLFIYLAEPHCVLCRAALPYYPGINVFRVNALNWEKDIVGLFDLAPDSSQGPTVVGIKTTLKEKYPIIGSNIIVRHKGGEVAIAITRDRPSVKHRPFFFAHQLCCKAVEALSGSPGHREIYDVAMQTQEILPRDCWGEEPPTHLASFLGTIQSGIVDTENTDLGSCLSRCSQMPPELQYRILGFLHGNGNTIVFSLMTALQTFITGRLLLMPSLPYQIMPGPSFNVDHVDTVHVCASLVHMFGRSYLWGLEFLQNQDHRPTPGKECMEVKLHSIRQMEFILGIFGIAAIRFHMDDGSITAWLGDARKGWRCKLIDFTSEHMRFPRSGQKDLVRRFAELIVQSAKKDAPLNVLWDASWRLLKCGVSFIAHYYTEPPSPRPNAFLGLPMCRYLPLRLDGHHARAITVYVFDLGMGCLVVHGNAGPRWVSVPLRKGVARTFYFRNGEEITTLGLVTSGDRSRPCGPFLLFKTNLDRMAYFGPAMALIDATSRWESLIPDHLDKKCTVSGLIVDQMAISYNFFKTIGAHCTPKEGVAADHKPPTSSSGLHFTLPDRPRVMRRLGFGIFSVVNSAHLYDIKQLRILLKDARDYDNNRMYRCCGLWILYGDGSVETVGSWDESLTQYANVIYNEADGRLTRVIFRFKEGRHPCVYSEIVRYVSEVTTRVVPHGSEEEDPDEEPSGFTETGDYLVHCKIGYLKKVSAHFNTIDEEQLFAKTVLTNEINPV
ncbi:uncharacterized protein Triagg1_7227 [Trichoderma aggressivum f. europaeum]|uniref:Uncharacterized protein n=1 Tax=Trichoderma aggressivum f. europaeum TaxID=173218 RepID=A0AAE1I9Z4_9HYPO|nr:hypothetical protein Triagg1_7227 [Trichoderma aggressivum f. europaeum]